MRGHHGPHPPYEEGSEPNEKVKGRFHLGHYEIRERCEYRGGDDRGDNGSLYFLFSFFGFHRISMDWFALNFLIRQLEIFVW